MRTMFYWAVVLFFFGSGTWLIINEKAGAPYEIPYLSSAPMNLPFASAGNTVEVLPVKEWEDILQGKWEYTSTIYKERNKVIFEGDVEYLADGSFLRRVTLRYYDLGDVNFYMAGGKVTGEWKVNSDSTWSEIINKCVIKASKGDKDFDVCDEYFKGTGKYGVKESDVADYELISFNHLKIEIHSKNLTNGKTDSFVFIRVGEASYKKKREKKPIEYENESNVTLSQESNESFIYYANIDDPDGFTYVRNKPSMKGEIIDTVFLGEKFKVLDDKLKWYSVKTPKGIKGYMYSSRVRKIH